MDIKRIFLLLLLLTALTAHAHAATYPAVYEVLNTQWAYTKSNGAYVRAGLLPQGELVVVNQVFQDNGTWGTINFNGRMAYVPLQQMKYLHPAETSTLNDSKQEAEREQFKLQAKAYFQRLFYAFLIVLFIVIVIVAWDHLIQITFYIALCAGLGALLFSLWDAAGTGAIVGVALAALIGFRLVANSLGGHFSQLFGIIYYVVSAPIYLLNRLQYFLVEPWRNIFKTSWISDNVKQWLRPLLNGIKVLLYIATTPLRILNAVLYNICVHVVTELYDLLFEVLMPSSKDEGGSGLWQWLCYLPLRIVKYPVFHGTVLIVESLLWTVIDTFIPAITMYHGTDLTAGQAIASSTNRNQYLRITNTWSCGTFTASQSSWGGIGVYFASKRWVAKAYATDSYRLDDNNPVMIACRVSMGWIINYALAPRYIYQQAGQYGKHSELNTYAERHRYTTGEWWNEHGGYWEYCMFDWRNRYNYPWRIRPIYLYNFRTHTAQHIKGGLQHWFFDRAVLASLGRSLAKWFK